MTDIFYDVVKDSRTCGGRRVGRPGGCSQVLGSCWAIAEKPKRRCGCRFCHCFVCVDFLLLFLSDGILESDGKNWQSVELTGLKLHLT